MYFVFAAPRATLRPHTSPNFPRAQYLDISTLTHELIVKYLVFYINMETVVDTFLSHNRIRNSEN